jgi:hypothetical protein
MRAIGFIFEARLGCWLLLLLITGTMHALGATNEVRPDAILVEIRGRVVCLAEEMHQRHEAALPTGHAHLYGFKTQDAKYYTLLRTKFSEALFSDPRFREKELLLKGRVFPNSQIFETTTIRSIRNGVVQDIYYYCDVCDIQSVAPGPCECCQGPTELVEKPLP